MSDTPERSLTFEFQDASPLICRTDVDGMVSMTTRTGRASTWFLLEKYGDKIFDAGAHSGGSGRIP